jgi:iron complex outermembrane recepter protein
MKSLVEQSAAWLLVAGIAFRACAALAAEPPPPAVASGPEAAASAAAPAASAPEALASGAAAAPAEASLDRVVITAQKRKQSINSVPMSVSALFADQLAEQGVTQVGDLQKLVPGFRYSEGAGGNPVYYIRGVGFNDPSLGTAPNVSVYIDEVPLAFPAMTGGVGLDLERVEVLKGPQGTLFGQNSTGGAINYIAAKPTKTFKSAIDLGYASFNDRSVGGYVSGPLTDTLAARLAFKVEKSGPWQQSYTSDRELGRVDKTNLRLLLDWRPMDKLSVVANLSGYTDKSDGQANQYVGYSLQSASGWAKIPEPYKSLTVNYPIAPANNRTADWGPGTPSKNDRLKQQSVRAEYDLGDDTRLTYIGAHASYKLHRQGDPDGVSYVLVQGDQTGDIASQSHELRLTGSAGGGAAKWIVGANLDRSTVDQVDRSSFDYSSNTYIDFTGFGGPLFHFSKTNNLSNQTFNTKAVFGNLDYDLGRDFVLHAAARYTKTVVRFTGCSADSGDGEVATLFNFFGNAFFKVDPGALPGQCFTTDVNGKAGIVNSSLAEHNVSWRLGGDWKFAKDSLLYANVSKGYKGGSFPILSASQSVQLQPVTQESLVAYEIGIKAALPELNLGLTGAVFHYDYANKQILGRVPVPVFGALSALVNVPESTVNGVELQAKWRPLQGLVSTLGVTYLNTKIGGDFTNYDDFGALRSFAGEPFPNTPKLQANLDTQYSWSVSGDYGLSAGANIAYQAGTYSGFGQVESLKVAPYTTLDLRASIEAPDGKWRLTVFGLNVTNKYYSKGVSRTTDTIVRVAGAPRTFGVNLNYEFR